MLSAGWWSIKVIQIKQYIYVIQFRCCSILWWWKWIFFFFFFFLFQWYRLKWTDSVTMVFNHQMLDHFDKRKVCALCVWEWRGAWLLSLRPDQHAGWGAGQSGDWIQRLRAPALPLISPSHLSRPLCCRSTEAQLGGERQTHIHGALSASPLTVIHVCLFVCLSVSGFSSLRLLLLLESTPLYPVFVKPKVWL